MAAAHGAVSRSPCRPSCESCVAQRHKVRCGPVDVLSGQEITHGTLAALPGDQNDLKPGWMHEGYRLPSALVFGDCVAHAPIIVRAGTGSRNKTCAAAPAALLSGA